MAFFLLRNRQIQINCGGLSNKLWRTFDINFFLQDTKHNQEFVFDAHSRKQTRASKRGQRFDSPSTSVEAKGKGNFCNQATSFFSYHSGKQTVTLSQRSKIHGGKNGTKQKSTQSSSQEVTETHMQARSQRRRIADT